MAKMSRPEAAGEEQAGHQAPGRVAEAAIPPSGGEVRDGPAPATAGALEVRPPADSSKPAAQPAVADVVAPSEPTGPQAGRTDRVGLPIPVVPALRRLQRLQGIVSSFWQDQLGRNLAAGEAMLQCRSPQALLGLQVNYVQTSLASGVEHTGRMARLSQDFVRDMLPGH